MSVYSKRYDKIMSKIEKARAELRYLWASCPHTNVAKKHRADDGNWCKADDRWWIEYDCPDCHKHWEEDQ